MGGICPLAYSLRLLPPVQCVRCETYLQTVVTCSRRSTSYVAQHSVACGYIHDADDELISMRGLIICNAVNIADN